VNISTFQDSSTERKKSRPSYYPSYLEGQDLMDVQPQLRRSRRLAQRAAASTSSRRFDSGC
jgi:hypothetical protein